MKFLKKALFAIPFLSIFVLSVGTQFSSCKKTVTVQDTTIVTVQDTVFRPDSVYNLAIGLIAYYNFNGGSLHDSSGNGNDITLDSNATLTSDRFGNPGNAFSFDGSTSYMQVPNSSSLNPDSITLFAIIKINGFYQGSCTINQVLGKGFPDDVDGFYNIRFSNTTPCTSADTTTEHFYGAFGDNLPYGATGGSGYNSLPLAQEGQWVTLAFTSEGLISKFYINGVLANQEEKVNTFTPNADNLIIGKHGDPSFPYYFNGVIDDIRIYNHALPAGEIKQLSNVTE